MVRAALALSLSAAAVQAAGAQQAPSIDDVVWHEIESYCSFMREGHTFVFDDPQTWRWVLFTNYPVSAEDDPLATPFMRIDGQLKQLRQTAASTGEDGTELRTYETLGSVPYMIEMALRTGEKGYESTAYSGTLRVSRDGMAGEAAFTGDCGV